MAVAQNSLHMDRHSARQHAWQISDEQHTMAYRKSHHHMTRGVNERDGEEAQSILLHHLNNREEIVDLRADHWLVLFEEARDIMLAQSLSVAV